MKNRKKTRDAFTDHSYWQSYSDMMAALLLIFILMIAITLSIYKQKNNDLENTRLDLDSAKKELELAQADLDLAKEDLEHSKETIEQSNKELAASLAQLQEAYANAALTEDELNKAYLEIEEAQNELTNTKEELENIVGIRTDIIGTLQETFNNSEMVVDAQTGSITFSSDVLFRYNSATLTDESKKILQDVIPKYIEVLLKEKFRDYVAEIIIEGHTDTDGGYKGNMDLSYNRANAVANFCLDGQNGLSEKRIEQLQKILTVNGRSCSNPIYKVGSDGKKTQEVDMDASRRVEIKFRLKEDEMITKISELLEQ